MIILTLLIATLGVCGLAIGGAIATRLAPEACFDATADRVYISVWLGVLVLANVLLAVSLFSPLTPAISLAVMLPLAFIVLNIRCNRKFLKELARSITIGTAVSLFSLILGVAAYCSQVIVWYDTRLYHTQVIKWLSEYGLVPGLALIHSRFGYPSSWFTLPAMFNHGPLLGKSASLAGGFSLLMLVTHLLTALHRTFRKQARASEMFIVMAYLPTLAVVMLYGMPNSPSPDLPVIILTIETAWCMMVVSAYRDKDPGHFNVPLNAALIPLLLGGGAVSIKMSAMPLMAVSIVYYLATGRLTPGKTAVASAVLAFFLAPLAAAGLVTTGCAFYPASSFCTDLPWSLGATRAAAESQLIRDWARWSGALSPAGATDWNWIIPWFQKEKISSLFLLLSAGAVAAILAHRHRKRRMPAETYVISLAATGVLFMLFKAPTWRFGLGYLVILPALFAADHTQWATEHANGSRHPNALSSEAVLAIITALVIATHIYIVPRPTFKPLEQFATANQALIVGDRPHFNFLLPPRIWRVDFEIDPETGRKTAASLAALIKDRSSDVDYYRPDPAKSELCGDAPLPCSPVILDDVRLRDNGKGIAGGFINSRRSSTGK